MLASAGRNCADTYNWPIKSHNKTLQTANTAEEKLLLMGEII
jgi:hypothetical protein